MKVIRFAVSHPVTIWMATLAAVVFGFVALSRLDMKLLPEIRYPTVTIQTEFPNTAPADVENLVTRPLEEAVGVVPGLVKIHSISQSGLSQITLEFDWGTNMDFASLDVREKIDLLQLPREALSPVLLKYDPALDPVLRIGLSGDKPLVYLRNIAEDVIKKEIETQSGVAAAKVAGGLEEEIRVEIDENRLSALGIPLGTVNQILTEENINASGGRLRDRNAEYIIRTLSRFENIGDIEDVIVSTVDGRAVRIRDIATVSRAYRERTTISHVGGVESVEIAIYKEGDENIVDLAERIGAHLDRVRERLPEGVRLEVLFDQSIFISRAIAEVRQNALFGGLLAVLVLLVFLRDLRSTAVIAVAIPVSIIATFILMYSRNVSLNVMSLGGLALGVGMLVDNSIVVLEAIHRRLGGAAKGKEEVKAIVQGAAEVGGAVTASTLTTVAVFVPIVFVVVGVAGQIFRDQALTVTFSLFMSLIVALTFTPMAMAWGRARSGDGEAVGGVRSWRELLGERTGRSRVMWAIVLFVFVALPVFIGRGFRAVGRGLHWLLRMVMLPLDKAFASGYPRLQGFYEGVLAGALRRRAMTLLIVVVMAAGAVMLAPTLGLELIPPLTQGELTLALELPEGTPLSRTATVMESFQRELKDAAGVALVAANVGVSRDGQTTAERRKENRAEVYVKLADSSKETEIAVLEKARQVLTGYPELSMKLRRQSLFSFNAPVEVDVYGYNLTNLQETADRVAAELAGVDGLRDIKLGMVPGSPEVRVSFDRDKMSRLGLSLAQVSETLRGKVRGTVASRLRERERHVDIRVMNEAEQRNTMTALQDLIVAERDGIPVPLSAIASYEIVRGPAEIHRLGRQRVAIVTANLAGRDLGSVTEELTAKLRRLPLPAGMSVELGGQNEEMQDSYRSLRYAVLLAIFLVYLVMAAQFESFVYPLIIMFTVPLALTGAIFGLKLTGTSISVIAVIGAIMLAGIVVNNGIVLVDRINQLRRQLRLDEAVKRAGRERFRPILMTTATTVLGLLPMALGLGEGAELRMPLAVTVISGLLFATGLTLVVVPVAYTLLTPGRVKARAGQSAPAASRLTSPEWKDA